MVLGTALESQTWFHLSFIGSEPRLTQHSLLLLSPSHTFPCPSLTLDLLVMESQSEWDHFTNLNKRKTNISRLSTLTAHPAARESLRSHRRGGRVEWDLPCQGQLQSDKTQFTVHPHCCSWAPQPAQASTGARAGLAWVPSLQHSAAAQTFTLSCTDSNPEGLD